MILSLQDELFLLVWKEFSYEVLHRDYGLLLMNDSRTTQTVNALLSSLDTYTTFRWIHMLWSHKSPDFLFPVKSKICEIIYFHDFNSTHSEAGGNMQQRRDHLDPCGVSHRLWGDVGLTRLSCHHGQTKHLLKCVTHRCHLHFLIWCHNDVHISSRLWNTHTQTIQQWQSHELLFHNQSGQFWVRQVMVPIRLPLECSSVHIFQHGWNSLSDVTDINNYIWNMKPTVSYCLNMTSCNEVWWFWLKRIK